MQTHGGGNSRKQQFRDRLGVLRDTAVKRHLPEGRWTRRHWIHASLFTTIGVLMATIVPGFSSAIQVPVSEPRNTLHSFYVEFDRWLGNRLMENSHWRRS